MHLITFAESIVSSFNHIILVWRSDEERKAALPRHRLDYMYTTDTAVTTPPYLSSITHSSMRPRFSGKDSLEEVFLASQHLSHLLQKVLSNNRIFAAELQPALECSLQCHHPFLTTMAKCANRHMDRMSHIWGVPRANARDIMKVALKFQNDFISEAFGSGRYDPQSFHDLSQMVKRLGICEYTRTSKTSVGLLDDKVHKEATTYEPEVLGLVGDTEVSCFPDKGAGCNFMSLQHAERHGIPVIPPDPNSRTTRLGNGKQVEIAGHATMPFSFKGETKSHQLEFVVLPQCIKDVILGSPFLRLTKLFEHHAHRIVRKIRTFSGARACYTASQERVVGMLDGELVHALPDTGSDVMLVSETYAKRRGLHVHRDTHYCFPLTFADGSQSWTSGIAKDVSWQYGTDGGESTLCDFYVLKDLQCDVLLSYDFLHRTDAFSLHEQWMDLLEDPTDFNDKAHSEWLLSTITRNSASTDPDSRLKRLGRKVLRSGGGKQVNPAVISCQPDPAHAWDREHRRLLRNLQTIDEQMKKLPPGQQDDARIALEAAEAAFKKHMKSLPGGAASPAGGNNSSASSSTAAISQAGS